MPRCSRLWDSAEFRRMAGGEKFLENFPSTMVIDLKPDLDECYTLGPYTLFRGQDGKRTKWGDLLYQAKYQDSQEALLQICAELEDFLRRNPIYSSSQFNAVVAAPKGDSKTPDLVGNWARELSRNLGWTRVESYKKKTTEPQKNFINAEKEQDCIDRIAGSIGIREIAKDCQALVLDDTIGSGGTFREIARALRLAGAQRVSGLAVAKDAHFTQGGRDFLQEDWWKC